MKALILAAGEGKRMLPLTLFRPKPMLAVAGKPLLHHIIDSLPGFAREIILVIGYKGEMIRDYFGESFQGRAIHYIEQKEKTGTADALKLCRPHISDTEKFLLLYADDLHHEASIAQLSRHDLGLLVYEVDDPRRFGVVVADPDGRITDIEEKPKEPKSNMAAIGVYVLDGRIFDYESDPSYDGERYLTGMIQKLTKDHPVYAERASFWLPVGYPEDLAKAEKVLSQRSVPRLAYRD